MFTLYGRLRQAARRLLRTPGFTLAAVLTLGLGVGATTAVFSVVHAVLLRPLPYDDSGRLVDLSHTLAISGISHVDQSDASYLYYRRANHVFTDVGAYRTSAVNVAPLDAAGESERLSAGFVTASLFSVLHARPVRGRALTDRDERPGAPPVVIIGAGLWKRMYGSDPGIVGRRVRIDGVAREVIGIMPADFRFPAADVALWLPTGIDPAATESANFGYRAVARLRDGVSIDAAAADLQSLLPRIPEAFPGRLTASAIELTHMQAVVRPLRDVVVGDIGRVLWVVLAAVAFVLLIAAANVANLLLVRVEARQKELAVRRALGAGRGALLTEFLAEGLVLAAAGGALGVALASAGIDMLHAVGGGIDIPRLAEVGIDAVVLGFACATTTLVALFVSGLAAARSAAVAPAAALAETGRSATAGRARHRSRNALVASQVALALVLLVGSGLMARSFLRLRAVHPGFEPAHVLTFRVALPDATYPSTDDAARFFIRALDEISALAGVEAAGVVSKLPLDLEGRRDSAVFVQDRPPVNGIPGIHPITYATAGYFRALGIPLVEGRAFERPDPARGPTEVVVSRGFAQQYWNGEDAIGKQVRMMTSGPWYTVVGVVGDVRGTALERLPEPTVYTPLVTPAGDARWTPHAMAFVVRTTGDPARIAAAVQRTIHSLDPALPVYHVRPMHEILSHASARTSFTLLMLAAASAVALLLGAVGIYGVISYVVSLRTREIGIRLALGATPEEVSRRVLRHGFGIATLGIAVGLAAALLLTRFIAALLVDVSPADPVTLATAAALLLAIAAVASWLPARRATRVDPVRALRAE
ncbi:MAG TPA: ABC transporter permease [Longimicrobiales bacterium]